MNEIEETIKIELDLNAARLVPKPTTAKSAAGKVRHDSIEDRYRFVRRINSYVIQPINHFLRKYDTKILLSHNDNVNSHIG